MTHSKRKSKGKKADGDASNIIGPAICKQMDGLKKFPREKDSIFLYSITKDEMSNIINSLPNKSSSGVDDISNKILKHLKKELVTPLTIVFKKSIEGVFPTRLKLVEIILLYKGKERFLLNNYGLISLLLTLAKCLEKAMYYRISQFIEFHNIFYDHQYGFRILKGHSTID